ncbi:calcium-dependent protein kinase 24 [Euphorbia lathyris]|uniref:calcium-dependent protein kinase 24 n=1 Tax=Euphorbia lathyris TaxID=212925 RepID=UPI003313C791
MGGCISGPLKAGRIISRKLHLDNRPRAFSELGLSSPRSFQLLIENVINEPKGDNITEKYEFGKELGRGEFGITYKCQEIETGKWYACKTISKAKLKTEIDIEDVRREVEIMRHLPKHPNIVRYKEAFEDSEAIYLIMEICEGGELFDRIVAKGYYTERAAAMVTKTILEVVKVCHDDGVIHRDLKPENFLFVDESEDSDLKAIDFGLSIFYEHGQRFSEIVGSPYYMAPEVLRRNYGAEVDVWSTGVILYILLCGVPPFWAETEEGIAHAIIGGDLDLTREPWNMISQDAKNLVKDMLDANPYSRLTVKEALEHPWIRNAKSAPNINLGENVATKIKQFSLMNKFKKKVLSIVANNLTHDEIDKIKDTFNLMDTDKNGYLSFDELKCGLRQISHPLPDPDVRLLMEAADLDGNGALCMEEFVTMAVHMIRIGDNEESLRRAFNYFDQNKTGYIEFDELEHVMLNDKNIDLNSKQVIQDIISDVDLDRDGRISYEEFKSMMRNGMDWKMASRQYSRVLFNALSVKILKNGSTALKA